MSEDLLPCLMKSPPKMEPNASPTTELVDNIVALRSTTELSFPQFN